MDEHIFTRLLVSQKFGVKLILLCEESVKIYDAHKWYVIKDGNPFYVVRHVRIDGTRNDQRLHRILMKLERGDKRVVDHQNRNGLDNRITNLRVYTHQQNIHNQGMRSDNISGIKGVYWNKQHEKWRAQIMMNGKHIYIGLYDDIEDARIAIEAKRLELHGDFANNG